MDALKKAQEAKMQAQDGGDTAVVENPASSQSADIDDAEFDSILTKKVSGESVPAVATTRDGLDTPDEHINAVVSKSELNFESSKDALTTERPLERSVLKTYAPTTDLELSFDTTVAPTRSGDKKDFVNDDEIHARPIEVADAAPSEPEPEPAPEPQLTSAIFDDVLRDLETDLAKHPADDSHRESNVSETRSNDTVPATKVSPEKNAKPVTPSNEMPPAKTAESGKPPSANKPSTAHPRRAANIMSATGKTRRLAPWIRTVLIGGGALLIVTGIGGVYFYDEYQRLVSPNGGFNPPMPQRVDPSTPGQEPAEEMASEENDQKQDMGALTKLAQIAPELVQPDDASSTRPIPMSESTRTKQPPATKTSTLNFSPDVMESREPENIPTPHETSVSMASPQQQRIEVPRSKPTTQAIDVKRIVPREDKAYLNLSAGYNAYQSGNFGAASHHYQLVLESMPENRDALLGMAAIYQKNGETAQAKDFYQRVLRQNRNDSVALAGWYSAMNDGDPLSVESELKVLMSRQGESSYLHFALGNAYARQNKWVAAEQAFSAAVRTDPTNADYAYNYAVSLDQLGRYDSATRYYEAALMQDRGGSAFDRDQVQQRLRELREPS